MREVTTGEEARDAITTNICRQFKLKSRSGKACEVKLSLNIDSMGYDVIQYGFGELFVVIVVAAVE